MPPFFFSSGPGSFQYSSSSCGKRRTTSKATTYQLTGEHIILHTRPILDLSVTTNLSPGQLRFYSLPVACLVTFSHSLGDCPSSRQPQQHLPLFNTSSHFGLHFCTMSPRSTWIERGPDGRPYTVKEKSKEPSALQLLSQALFPRSAHSQVVSRDSRHCQHVKCISNATDGPLALPAPDSSDPSFTQTPHPPLPMAPTSQAPQQPVTMYLVPPQPDPNQQEVKNNQAHGFFPAPPLGVYPIPPHPMVAPTLPLLPPPVQFQHQPAPFPIPSVGALPLHTQPNGAQALLPAPAAPAQDQRYKCEICGRYRSARYHYRHPILPGHAPAKTICRKCREEATDSEDDSSSDSYRSFKSRRRHSRPPSHRSVSFHKSKPNHSRSRPRQVDRDRMIGHGREQQTELSASDSSSSDTEGGRFDDRARRSRRPDLSNFDLVRRTRRVHLSPRGEQVSYDSDHGDRGFSYDREVQDEEYGHESIRT